MFEFHVISHKIASQKVVSFDIMTIHKIHKVTFNMLTIVNHLKMLMRRKGLAVTKGLQKEAEREGGRHSDPMQSHMKG